MKKKNISGYLFYAFRVSNLISGKPLMACYLSLLSIVMVSITGNTLNAKRMNSYAASSDLQGDRRPYFFLEIPEGFDQQEIRLLLLTLSPKSLLIQPSNILDYYALKPVFFESNGKRVDNLSPEKLYNYTLGVENPSSRPLRKIKFVISDFGISFLNSYNWLRRLDPRKEVWKYEYNIDDPLKPIRIKLDGLINHLKEDFYYIRLESEDVDGHIFESDNFPFEINTKDNWKNLDFENWLKNVQNLNAEGVLWREEEIVFKKDQTDLLLNAITIKEPNKNWVPIMLRPTSKLKALIKETFWVQGKKGLNIFPDRAIYVFENHIPPIFLMQLDLMGKTGVMTSDAEVDNKRQRSMNKKVDLFNFPMIGAELKVSLNKNHWKRFSLYGNQTQNLPLGNQIFFKQDTAVFAQSELGFGLTIFDAGLNEGMIRRVDFQGLYLTQHKLEPYDTHHMRIPYMSGFGAKAQIFLELTTKVGIIFLGGMVPFFVSNAINQAWYFQELHINYKASHTFTLSGGYEIFYQKAGISDSYHDPSQREITLKNYQEIIFNLVGKIVVTLD